jgi:hypothetical protein
MKNPVQYKKIEPGSAFHEKKDKNKKINLGGPSKRKPPKTKPANRAQAKAKSIAKKEINFNLYFMVKIFQNNYKITEFKSYFNPF